MKGRLESCTKNQGRQKKNKKTRIQPYQTTTVTNRSNEPIPVQVSSLTNFSRPGKCNECGKSGHWRKDHTVAQNNEKISIEFRDIIYIKNEFDSAIF